MPSDPTKPLLRLASSVTRERTVKGSRPPFPPDFPHHRQSQRIGPKFDQLREALARANGVPIQLREDPTALAPESLIVFELRAPLVTFAAAVAGIPGLELVAEEDEELADDDGAAVTGHFYAVFTNQRALEGLLSLWDRWLRDEPLSRDQKPWQKIFSCLHDLRRWGARDRVSVPHAEIIRRAAEEAPDSPVFLEVELVYRPGGAGEAARRRVRDELATSSIREISAARYDEFAFDALLISVAPHDALAIAARMQDSLAGLNDAFRIRPQSIGYGIGGEDRDTAPVRHDPDASGDPIVALFDGVPVANHPYLAAHIQVDDPDDVARWAVGPRLHGTAMASLVLYGDLLGTTDMVVRRPIYVRPFMADTDNFPGISNERTLSDRLLVDDIARAVRRVKVGETGNPPLAPAVVVFNISFGIPDLVFDGTMSPLARCLDWLSSQYGVLFVVSAGNATESLAIAAFADDSAFSDSGNAERTEAVLGALRDVKHVQRLLSPAESVNALTVGALHDDAVGAGPNVGTSYDPLPEGRLPSVYSRVGLGFARSTKPDVLAPGARLRVQARPESRPASLGRKAFPSRLGGLRVAGIMDPVAGPQLTWSGGTSGAAALTTHALHRIHDALEDAYGATFLELSDPYRALILKTMALHRAYWPVEELDRIERIFGQGVRRHYTVMRGDIARLFGFGLLDQDSAIACAFSRATAWGTGSVHADRGQVFRMPLPESLIGRRTPKSLTATVCWFSPIVPSRQSYRGVKLRIDEAEASFGESIDSLGVRASAHQLDSRATGRGTVLHRRWDGDAAASFRDGDAIEIKVSRMPDDLAADVPATPFALAVSIETEAELPIYEQVMSKIDVRLRPRIPQAIRA